MADCEILRRVAAAVGVALLACAPSSVVDETPSDTSTGQAGADSSSGAAVTTSVTETSASTTVDDTGDTTGMSIPPDATCEVDSDCGELNCYDGVCEGCVTYEDCADGLVCWGTRCILPSDAPTCAGIAAPVCGDGEIGALEECDGSPGCNDCRADHTLTEWFDAEDVDSLVMLADGGALFVGRFPVTLTRVDASGDTVWSVMTESRLSYASDATGLIYGAGSATLRKTGFSYIEALDDVGAVEWSAMEPSPGHHNVIAADAGRVLVGGITEQANAADDRALLAQYDTGGTLQWSRKVDEWSSIIGVATDDDDAVVLAAPLYLAYPWSLERIDDAGETVWRVPLAPDLSPPVDPYGMTGDGSGGSWSFGDRDAGAWAVRHDATGDEIDRLECFGNTTGWITHLAVSPSGVTAIAVLATTGPLPLAQPRPWIALLEDGVVTGGIALGEDGHADRLFDLRWRADGRLVLGVDRSDSNEQLVLVMEPQ